MDRSHAFSLSNILNPTDEDPRLRASATAFDRNPPRASTDSPDESVDTRKRTRSSTSVEDVSQPSTSASSALEPFAHMNLGADDDPTSPHKRRRTLTDEEISTAPTAEKPNRRSTQFSPTKCRMNSTSPTTLPFQWSSPTPPRGENLHENSHHGAESTKARHGIFDA